MTAWTTPDSVRDKLTARWNRGVYLTALAAGAPFEPVEVKITGPKTAELNSRRAEVADWAQIWHHQARQPETQVSFRSVGGRGLVGRTELPDRLRVDSLADLEVFLGTAAQTRHYRELLALTAERPGLGAWVAAKPMRALEHYRDFPQLLAALDWLSANAGTGRQLREIDAAGIDTKFIERHQRILLELGALVVPPDLIDTASKTIAGRFGFATPARRVRLRRLDAELDWPLGSFDDVEVRTQDLADCPLQVDHVIIAENLATYLALPAIPRAVALFGGGYAATTVGALDWLAQTEVLYWGDLDTHGFAILDRLRAVLPSVCSVLMDTETLLAHRQLWGREPSQITRDLPNLTAAEARCYRELTDDVHGVAVRLEQERIPMTAAAGPLGKK